MSESDYYENYTDNSWDGEEDDQLNYDDINFIDEVVNPSSIGVLLRVEPPSVLYAGRFSLKKDNKITATKIIEEYIKKWKITNYIFCYEISQKKVPHVHFICRMKKEYASSTMTDFWARQEGLREDKEEGHKSITWHKDLTDVTIDDRKKLLDYTVKDMSILKTDYDKPTVDILLDKAKEIKEDKKLSPLDKLIVRLKKKYENNQPSSLGALAMDIDEIYYGWGKPPPIAQIKGWTLFIWRRLGFSQSDIRLYYEKLF